VEPATIDETPTPPPERRLRARWIVLGVLVLTLIVAGVLYGPLGWQILTSRNTTLGTPDTVAGLHHDTTADAAQTAIYLRDALAADVPITTPYGAVYADPADKTRSVLLFGGTGLLVSPDKDLDRALTLLNDQTGSVTGLHTVPAGSLGGTMKCGNSTGDGGPMGVCGWVDHGCLAVALFPGRSAEESAGLMRQLRAGIQHRG
jgi:hypothetical protein